MSYTPNPFDLLGDEVDDHRPRKQAPKQAAPKPATTPAAAPANKASPQPPSQQQKAAAPAKAGSAPAPSSAPKKDTNEVKKPQGDAPKGKTDYVKKPQSSYQGGQGGAPRAGKDEYESEKTARPPKDKREGGRDRLPQRGRQFDRRSGTGRPANENKRSGSGKGNWGTQTEGQEPGTEGAPAKEQVEGEKDEAAPAADAEPTEGEVEVPKEPEYKSLDEYLESIKGRTVRGVEAPKLRVAGEGVDQSAWSDYAPLARDEDAEPIKKKKTETKKENGKEGKEEKISVDKYFRVTMPRPQGVEERRDRRGPPGGGDRRGGRGGGSAGGKGPRVPRGGDRPGKPAAQSEAKPSQANGEANRFLDADFPALGGLGGVAPAPAHQTPAPVKA